MDWTDLTQDGDRWWGCRGGGNKASRSIKCGEFLIYLRRTLLHGVQLFDRR